MKRIGFLFRAPALVLISVTPGWSLDQIPGQVDVMFKQDVTLTRQQSGFISCGISYIDSVNEANNLLHLFNVSCGTCPLLTKSYIAIFPDTANIAALVSAYLADTANIKWASARYYPDLSFTPNDSFFVKPSPSARPSSYQWPLDSTHLQMEKAWDITQGDTGTVIAILDLYHAWRHPDLEPTMWINSPEDRNGNGKFDPVAYPTGDLDSVDNDNDGYIDNVSGYHFKFYLSQPYIRCNANPEPIMLTKPDTLALAVMGNPAFKHGGWTWSNALAKTNNSSGVAGVGFNSRAMPVGFNPWIPAAVPLCYLLQIKLQHGVPDVVNISLVWNPNHNDSIILDSLSRLGVVLVAAAGNDEGGDYANYPARHPKVMSIAATDSNDYRADFSTVNSTIDLSAPGFNYMAHHYFTADSNKAYGYRYAAVDSSLPGNPTIRGTSFSSPQVVGVASLVQSLFPSWTVDQIVAKLRSSTDPILFNPELQQPQRGIESTYIAQGKLGTGRLNAFKAVTFFGNIPNAANDTTLDGTVYVSGDIKVRAGKTLRIAAGTVLKFYPGDVMKSGVDIAREEIIVDSGGTLIVQGTSGNPVQLISFKTSPGSQDWRGVVVKKGGSAKFFHTQFKHAYAGIDFQNSANDTVKDCLFDNTYMYGIITKNGNLKILNSTFKDIVAGYGIYLDSCNATVANNTITDVPYGINAYKSGSVITNNIIRTTGAYIADFGFRREGGSQTAVFSYDSVSGVFDQAAVVANGGLAVDACKIWPKFPNPVPDDPLPQMIGILGLGTAAATVQNTTVKMFTSNTTTAPAIKVDGTPVLDLIDF